MGNIASHTDGKNQAIAYTYDNASKLITVTYPDTTTVSYGYDVASRQTSMTDATGTTNYTLDPAGRTTQIAAPNGTTGYGYDTANRRTSMTLTGTGSWAYTYDNGNRLLTTTNPYSEVTTNGYDVANRLTSQTNGNASVTTTAYDTANRTTDVWHKTNGGTVLAHYQYGYDAASNVTSRTDSDGVVTTFGYDASDQLTSEVRDNSTGTGYSLAYTYDHNSNRLTKVTGTGMSALTDTYSYDSHDKLQSVAFGAGGSKVYAYDLNGNCHTVTVGTNVTTLTYDYENRVTGISYPGGATNSFQYNGNDLRTQKVDSTGTSNYVTDGTTPASAVLKDNRAVYTPGLSEHAGTASKFYHADALGSTRGITDSTQAVTDTTLYDAFGMTVSHTGTTATPFGFVGKSQYQTDGDSGLQLLGHRYYDASIGRFITSDPAQAGTNWYAYCENNPLKRTDSNGLDDEDDYINKKKRLIKKYQKEIDKVAKAALKKIMPKSNRLHREFGGTIYYMPGTGKGAGIHANTPSSDGDGSAVGGNEEIPDGAIAVGHYHTHPFLPERDNSNDNRFSPNDADRTDGNKDPTYIDAGIDGHVYRLDPVPYYPPRKEETDRGGGFIGRDLGHP